MAHPCLYRFNLQLLQSLCLLYEHGVIHCDLKPEVSFSGCVAAQILTCFLFLKEYSPQTSRQKYYQSNRFR